MKSYSIIVFLFACFLLTGGIFAFVKANSLASLYMSSSFALALMVSSYFSFFKKNIWGLFVSSMLIIFLNFFFLYRFIKTFAIFPAGLLTVLTTAIGIPLLSYLTKKINETKYNN